MAKTKGAIRVVVGIDLGATRAGFAYAFAADRRIVAMNLWPGQPRAYPKSSADLLYGPRRRLIAWGYPAARRYAELVAGGEERRYDLFSGFHDELHKSGIRTARGPAARGPTVERSGRRYQVVDLWADALRGLADVAWQTVGSATPEKLGKKDALWCLTVPAAWKPRQRELLARAARKAGLVGAGAGAVRRLLLVDEDDAIAVHCQESGGHALVPGERVVVVDAGGAGTRIAAYRVTRRRTLLRLASPPAPIPGANEIDRAFVEGFLREKLTAEVLAAYRAEEPVDFYEVLAEWERIKCHFDPETSLGASCLAYRPRLLRLFMTRFPEVYDRLTAEGHEDGLYVEPAEMAAFFEPVAAATVRGVRAALRQAGLRKADFLYLVGGLAGSPCFRERLRSRLKPAAGRLIVPAVPGAAAMEGAISYAFEPRIARQRRSRVTYGCGCETPHDPSRDEDERKIFCEELDGPYCRDRFLPFVEAGEVIEPGHEVRRVLSPMTSLQTEMLVDFYAARRPGVRSLDEDGVRKLGELRVKMGDAGGVERRVEVVMSFGESTVEVRARGRGTARGRRLTFPFSAELS